MSLRLRLLLAVGAVALTALAIADVVTYQELRSFLYSRIDQSLEQSHIGHRRGPRQPGPPRSHRAAGRSRRRARRRRTGRGPPSAISAPGRRPAVDDDDTGIDHDVDGATQLQRLRGPDQRLVARAATRHLRRGPQRFRRRPVPLDPARAVGIDDRARIPRCRHGSRDSSPTPLTSGSPTTYFTQRRRPVPAAGLGPQRRPLLGWTAGDRAPSGLDGVDPRPLGRRRAGRHRGGPRGGAADRVVARAGELPPAAGRREHGRGHRPRRARRAGPRRGCHAPRWDAWLGPSTSCWGASKGRSPSATPPSRSCGPRRVGCGSSSPMPRTSCAPR